MIQLREGSLFTREPLTAGRGQPSVTQDFKRNVSAKVSPLREINDSHSAFAQYFQDSIRTESLTIQGTRRSLRKSLLRNVADITVEQRAATRVLFEHGHDLDEKLLVAAANRLQVGSLVGLRQVCRVMKQISGFGAGAHYP